MHKKLLLLGIAAFGVLLLNAQTVPPTNYVTKLSATEAPDQAWDDWFNDQVAKYEKAHAGERTMGISRTIPVVFHIVHYGQAVGTFPNIDSAEVGTQIRILNQDYAGTGLNYTNVPIPFASLENNTGIHFCLARKDQNDLPLIEPGIHRVNANSAGWPNPATPTVNLVNYINNQIKPFTIWDPNKFLNIWVSDRSATTTVIGYATYPAGTTLGGIPTSGGTGSNDGVWCYAKCVGSSGAATAPYDKGRTLTREIAHWLGVRSLWGDGNCLDDYCNDTPWQKQGNLGYTTHPAFVNRCGPNQSPDGEMTMNFMDLTDDTARYMFTPRQTVRMQTAMSQGTYRMFLGTHSLCPVPLLATASASASFFIDAIPCIGVPFTPSNTSTGGPQPNYQWSSNPAATILPSSTVALPGIIFNTAGAYTLYLTATNATGNSTYSLVIPSVTTCAAGSLCLDTLSAIQNNDTLITYRQPHNSSILSCQTGFSGYLTGTNCYNDKEFAQFISATSYTSVFAPQVNSVIILFDSTGTVSNSPNTQIYCKLYAGTVGSGPLSQLAVAMDTLSKIEAAPMTRTITYCGIPTYTFTTTKVIPYKFDFAQPVVLGNNTSGFYASVQAPYSTPGDSINIFSNTKTSSSNDSTSWVLLNTTNNWRTIRYGRGAKVQLAILPQMTCRPLVGIQEIQSELGNNVAVVPNPNNGLFSLVFTLPHEEKLNITTYNAIGQQISLDQLDNVTHNVVNMDLSGKPAGIYFIHVSNGTDKVVKKIILTH